MGGLGPMAGQNHHFVQYAPEKLPYAIDRYVNETNRLYSVLNKRLADRAFLAGGDYSRHGLLSWTVGDERQQQKLAGFPHLERWYRQIEARPATARAYELGPKYRTAATMDEAAKKVLFGQTAGWSDDP